MIKIRFMDVGREKETFEVEVDVADQESMGMAVKGKIRSRDVEFATSPPNHKSGVVLVGGFRVVGTFKFIESECDQCSKQ